MSLNGTPRHVKESPSQSTVPTPSDAAVERERTALTNRSEDLHHPARAPQLHVAQSQAHKAHASSLATHHSPLPDDVFTAGSGSSQTTPRAMNDTSPLGAPIDGVPPEAVGRHAHSLLHPNASITRNVGQIGHTTSGTTSGVVEMTMSEHPITTPPFEGINSFSATGVSADLTPNYDLPVVLPSGRTTTQATPRTAAELSGHAGFSYPPHYRFLSQTPSPRHTSALTPNELHFQVASIPNDDLSARSQTQTEHYPYWNGHPRFNASGNASYYSRASFVASLTPSAMSLRTVMTPTLGIGAAHGAGNSALDGQQSFVAQERGSSQTAATPSVHAGARQNIAGGRAFTRNMADTSFVAATPVPASPAGAATAPGSNGGVPRTMLAGSLSCYSIPAQLTNAPAEIPLAPPAERVAPAMTVGDCILEWTPHLAGGSEDEPPLPTQISPYTESVAAAAFRSQVEDYLTAATDHGSCSGSCVGDGAGASPSLPNSAHYHPLRPPFPAEGFSMPSPQTPQTPPPAQTPKTDPALPLEPLSSTDREASRSSPSQGETATGGEKTVVGHHYGLKPVSIQRKPSGTMSESDSSVLATTRALLMGGDDVGGRGGGGKPRALDHTARPREPDDGGDAPPTQQDTTPTPSARQEQSQKPGGPSVGGGGIWSSPADDALSSVHSSPLAADITSVPVAPTQSAEATGVSADPERQQSWSPTSAKGVSSKFDFADESTASSQPARAPHVASAIESEPRRRRVSPQSAPSRVGHVPSRRHRDPSVPFHSPSQESPRFPLVNALEGDFARQSSLAFSAGSEAGTPRIHVRSLNGYAPAGTGTYNNHNNRSYRSYGSISNITVRPAPTDPPYHFSDPLQPTESYGLLSTTASAIEDPRTPANVTNRSAVIRSLGDPNLSTGTTPVPQVGPWQSLGSPPLTGLDSSALSLRTRPVVCPLEEMEDLIEVIRLFHSDWSNLRHHIPPYLYNIRVAAAGTLANLLAVHHRLTTTLAAASSAGKDTGSSSPPWAALYVRCTAISKDTLAPVANTALRTVTEMKAMTSRKWMMARWTEEALQEVFMRLQEVEEYTTAARAQSLSPRSTQVPPVLSRATPPPAIPTQGMPPPGGSRRDDSSANSGSQSGNGTASGSVKDAKLANSTNSQGLEGGVNEKLASSTNRGARQPPTHSQESQPVSRAGSHPMGSANADSARISALHGAAAVLSDERRDALAKAAEMNLSDLCTWLSEEDRLRDELDGSFDTFVTECHEESTRVALLHVLADFASSCDKSERPLSGDTSPARSLSENSSLSGEDDVQQQARYLGEFPDGLSSLPTESPDATAMPATSPAVDLADKDLSNHPREDPGVTREGRSPDPEETQEQQQETEHTSAPSPGTAPDTAATGAKRQDSSEALNEGHRQQEMDLLNACVSELRKRIISTSVSPPSHLAGVHSSAQSASRADSYPAEADFHVRRLPKYADVVSSFTHMESPSSWSWWYALVNATHTSVEHKKQFMAHLTERVRSVVGGSKAVRQLLVMIAAGVKERGLEVGASWLQRELKLAEGSLVEMEKQYLSRTRRLLQLMLRRIVLLSCRAEAPFGVVSAPTPRRRGMPSPSSPTNSPRRGVPNGGGSPRAVGVSSSLTVLVSRLSTHRDSVVLARQNLQQVEQATTRDAEILQWYCDLSQLAPAKREQELMRTSEANSEMVRRCVLAFRSGCDSAACTYCRCEGLYAGQEDNAGVVDAALSAIQSAAKPLLSIVRGSENGRFTNHRDGDVESPADRTFSSRVDGTAPRLGLGTGGALATDVPIALALLARRTHSQQTNAYVDEGASNTDEGSVVTPHAVGERPGRTLPSQATVAHSRASFATATCTGNNQNTQSENRERNPEVRKPCAATSLQNTGNPQPTATPNNSGSYAPHNVVWDGTGEGTAWTPRYRDANRASANTNSIEEQMLGSSAVKAFWMQSGKSSRPKETPPDLTVRSPRETFIPRSSTRALNRLITSLDELSDSLMRNYILYT